ncbi:hypothetical protein BKA69DRAFT_382882 [Paraphysoderma sedebokerense]|nr:hypothetical protein BKA69DRAFT_382882 [Paraphysoderma sedebokerense]
MPNHPSRNPDQTLRPEIQFSSPAAFQTPFPSDLELRNNVVGSDISKLDSAKSGDPKPLSAKTTSQYASDRSLSNDSFLATLSSMAKAHKNYPQEPTDAPIWASLNKIMGSNISISDPTNKNNASVEDDPTNEVFQSTRSLNTSFANLGQNVVDGSVSLSEPQTLQITAPLIDHQPSIRITKSAAILRTDSDLVGSDPSDPKSQLVQSQSLLPRGNSNLLIGEPILHPSKTDATPIVPSKENDIPHLDQKDSLKVIKSSPDELEQAIDNIFATRRRRRYCFSELFQKLKQNFESYLDPLWHWFKSRFIYLYKTPTCKFWGFTDAIICLLDFYNLISIPYVLAYICDTTLVQISIYFLIDLLLLIDVLLNLHRPVNDQYGQPVIKAHERRLHYLYTRQGWWEVIGSIPIEIIPLIMELGTKDFTRNSIVCRNPIFPPNSSEARWDYSPSYVLLLFF